MRLLLFALVFSACDTSHCEVQADRSVTDDEITGLGSVEEYLRAVETEALLAGQWWDGRPVELFVEVRRGEGEARYVDSEMEGQNWSWMQEMSIRTCPDVLAVPVHITIRSDDDAYYVDRDVEVEVREGTFDDPWLRLPVGVPYTEALAPDGDIDPSTLHSKTVWAELVYAYDAAEIAYVEAGWGGREDVAGSKHDAHRSIDVLEAGEDPSGQPPVTSEPE